MKSMPWAFTVLRARGVAARDGIAHLPVVVQGHFLGKLLAGLAVTLLAHQPW